MRLPKPRFRHIRSKLLFSYALILIVPCLLLGFGFMRVTDDMWVNQKVQDSEKEALVLSENLQYTLSGLGDTLADFCSDQNIWQYFLHEYTYPDTSIKGYFELIRPTVNRYVSLHPEILSGTMYATNPTVITNQSEIAPMRAGGTEEALMNRLLQSGAGWTLDLTESGGKTQLVAARVASLYKKPVGLFVLRLDQSRLQALIGDEREEGSVSIISHEGRVVLSSQRELLDTDAAAGELAATLAVDATDTLPLELNGQQQMATVVPFTVSGCRESWRLVLTDTMASLRRVADANLTSVALLGALVLLLMGVMSALFANRLTKRLSGISEGIARVEKGDFSVRVDADGEDEVSALAISLNRMTGRLDALISENASMRMQKRELEIAEREAKLYALQSQINPHFLFNTLEAVQYGIHARLDGTEEIVRLLAKNLRRIASWDSECVPLREELVNIQEHLTIQQFRYGDKLRYRIDVDEGLLDMQIPKLLLQPLVENAVTHGVAMKKDGGSVTVRVAREQDGILFAVEDDGVGMDELTREELRQTLSRPVGAQGGGSIGLKNVSDRVRLFYGERAAFGVSSEEGKGTSVTLKLKEATPCA